jgi:hypothetical protein
MDYYVTASLLNLRSSPVVDPGNVITLLKNQEIVTVIDTTNADFYKVRCIQETPQVEGYASSAFLKLVASMTTVPTGSMVPVNLLPNPASRRDNHAAWQYPIGEADMPEVDPNSDSNTRISCMHQIVDWLAVDKSARYQRDTHTYCNVYACDYLYLAGVFLPRVWWTGKALQAVLAGTKINPVYNMTVEEVNANGLFTWLETWGADFNWVRTYSLDDLQNQVNQGNAGVICAANIDPNRSGHICCVIPETADKTATRASGVVVCPLLSQAGAVNLSYYNNNPWWVKLAKEFRGFGFWYSQQPK